MTDIDLDCPIILPFPYDFVTYCRFASTCACHSPMHAEAVPASMSEFALQIHSMHLSLEAVIC